jgi:ring-1,2-phenylacetyl-CoA epoxidase subunit PaaB
MVFQQDAPDAPFVHNGTVHAPDAEIALLNARDVFGRRPSANAMWVVPIEAIFSRSREELETQPLEYDSSRDGEEYLIFGKLSQQGQLQHLGQAFGTSPEGVMKQFIDNYSGSAAWVWWVVQKEEITATDPQEVDQLFKPFEAHTFKSQADYPVITMMREIRAKGKSEE